MTIAALEAVCLSKSARDLARGRAGVARDVQKALAAYAHHSFETNAVEDARFAATSGWRPPFLGFKQGVNDLVFASVASDVVVSRAFGRVVHMEDDPAWLVVVFPRILARLLWRWVCRRVWGE